MFLRSILFQAQKDKRIQSATGHLLTNQWQALTQQQKDGLVKLILADPAKAGEKLRDALLFAIETEINNDLDTLLSGSVDPATLDSLL